MDITEVEIKLFSDGGHLLGFANIVFDHRFAVRDIKIIKLGTGPVISMPSRKITAHCAHCSGKNHLEAQYCNTCGFRLPVNRKGPGNFQ